MLVINLYGGPGAGKSTTRAGLFFKLKTAGVNAEEAPEYAKDLTWEGRKEALANQPYVFAKQLYRIMRLRGKVDVVVTDSPLILSEYYGRLYGAGEFPESFYSFIGDMAWNSHGGTVRYMDILLNRVKEYNPAGRNQTEAEAINIDAGIRDLLKKYSRPYIEVDGSISAPNIIYNLVKQNELQFPFQFDLRSCFLRTFGV